MREYCKKLILFAVIYYIFFSVSRLAYAVLADIGVSTLPIPLTLCLFEWYCTAPSKMVESCRGKQQTELCQDCNVSTKEQNDYVLSHPCP